MKFGCTLWPVRRSPPYEAAIERIAKLGFKGVELITRDRKTLDEYFTRKKNRELREFMESLEIELTGFNFPILGVTSLKQEDRDAALSNFKRQVEVASELDAKVITGSPRWPYEPWGIPRPNAWQRPLMQTFGVEQRNIPYDQDFDVIWKSYVSLVRKFADVVEDVGYRYAIETHAFEIACNADGLLRLLEQVDSKAVGANFDTAYMFAQPELITVAILKLKNRIFHVHLDDNDGCTPLHWRPGRGKIDWFSVLKALKAVGYDYVLALEMLHLPGVSRSGVRDDASLDYDLELVKAMTFLRSVAKEAGVKIE